MSSLEQLPSKFSGVLLETQERASRGNRECNMEVEAFQRLDPESFYRRFIKNSVRPDGRGLRTVRPISIDVEVLSDKHVQGSALVALGSTKVLAGITSQIGQPGESTPLSGAIGRWILHVPVRLNCPLVQVLSCPSLNRVANSFTVLSSIKF